MTSSRLVAALATAILSAAAVIPAANAGEASGAAAAAATSLTPAAIPRIGAPDGTGGEYSKSFRSMGTYFEIRVALDGAIAQDDARAAVDEAFEIVARLDTLLSTYKPDSEISIVNRNSGGGFTKVDPLVVAVLDSSLFYWNLTGGAFDVTVGPLMELWGFRGGRPRVPDRERLADALARVGASGLEIDRSGSSVRLGRPGAGLDLGGIGKGFALDRAADVLRSRGITNAMLNSGGNLLFMGSAGGRPWSAGIADPRSPESVIARFEPGASAVSTSGDYESYFIAGGVRYSHILDPRTGWPASGVRSATVIAPAATGADALSTAVLVMGAGPGMELVESIPGVEAVLITAPAGKGGAAGAEAPARLAVSSGLSGKLELLGGARLLTTPGVGR
jgi:thiamine biosynthesis lipoprotein